MSYSAEDVLRMRILAGLYDDTEAATEHFHTPPEPLGGAEVDPPAFDPDTMLPTSARELVVNVAGHLQVPVDAPALMSVSTLSTAAAGRAWVHGRNGWYQPLIIWTCTTMHSGERKSDTVRIVARPIRDAERDAITRWKTAKNRGAEEKEGLAAKEKRIKSDAKKAKGDEAAKLQAELENVQERLVRLGDDEPPMPRILVEDATPEALSQRLEENDERLGVLTAEGGIFALIGGRYSNGLPNLDIYLKSFDEEYLPFDRVIRGTIILRHPALAMGLLVQPHVLDKAVAVPGMRDRGLLGRFLFAAPKSMLGRRAVDAPAMRNLVTAEWNATIGRILRMPARPDPLLILELDDNAYKLLRELREQLEPHLDPAVGRFGYMSDWVGKLAGKVLRLAALYHLADGHGRERMIGEEHMTQAVALGLWALRHAEHVHRGWRDNEASPGVAPILAWLRKRRPETFTARDLNAMRNASWYSTDARDQALVELHKARWIASVAQYDSADKRRPSAMYVPHPTLLRGAR